MSKRKWYAKALYTVFALALVVGLTLVPAVAANDPVTVTECSSVEVLGTGEEVGTAGWSTEFVNNGLYAARLTPQAAAKVAYGETLSTLIGLGTEFFVGTDIWKVKWHFYYTEGANEYPMAMLQLDTDDDGAVDTILVAGSWAVLDSLQTVKVELVERAINTWFEAGMNHCSSWAVLGYDEGAISEDPTVDGIKYTTSAYESLHDWVAITAFGNATVMYVGNYHCQSGVAYVDDITIDGDTYEMEPPLPPLDEDYYKVGDEPIVTIYDVVANDDSMAIDFIGNPTDGTSDLHVTSTTDDTGDEVVLTETGADTGVFTGSFTLLGEAPAVRADDEIVVSEGDTITLTYPGEPELIVTAKVDDTAPTITKVFPEGTTDKRTPDIGAEYDAVPINSVELIFDGVDVTDDDATTVGTTSVSYTPEDDLPDGTYDVTVNIEDAAGNPATKTWSFSIASWLDGSPVSSDPKEVYSLDELDTVDLGLAVTITGDTGIITVGRYASNPQPEAPPTFTMIENGFFDVQVTGADTATLIVIKFADDNITADSVAYFWGDVEQEWIACSDQGTTADYLWVKVRTTTIPSIAELTGTPFAISGVPAVFDPWVYDVNDDDVIQKTEALAAIADYFDLEITKAEALEVIALYFG